MSSLPGGLPFGRGRRLPSIRQSEAAECGLACLAMISCYHGCKRNLASLRLEHPAPARGTTLNSLMVTANQLALTTRALSVELESLRQLKLPCILHWEMNHFVVLAKITRGRYVVHDPARGVRRYRREQVSTRFTGVALELSPSLTFARRDERRRMRLRDFWTATPGLGGALLQALVLSVIIQALVLAAPFYMQLVVDEVLTKFDVDLLIVLAIGFGLLMLLKEISVAVRAWQILYLGSSLDFGMVANLARHLFRLPLAWFEKRHVGDIVSRFSSTRAVRNLFSEGLVAAVIDGVMAASTLLIMFLYGPLLACVVVGALILYLALRLGCYPLVRDRTEDEIVARALEQTALIESIRAVQSVKVFGKEAQRHSYWQNRFAESVNAAVRLGRVNIGLGTANGLLFGLENILVVYLGAVAVIEGGFTVGMLFAFMAYKRNLVESTVGLIERLIEFRILGLHLDRVADIALSAPEPGHDLPGLAAFGAGDREAPLISLSNCRFSFAPDETPLLDNLSLDVGSGEIVTIVGPSGCGKSTLLKLVLGLQLPDEGRISYRGVPVSHIAWSDYRRLFGTVMQQDRLLSGTIAENIAFFDPAARLDKVEACARFAAIHEEIARMPMGYNSLIGDMGSVLSAGQRQRILLARALYAEPEILVLDEGTANLDPASEHAVIESLARLEVTCICVTHGDQLLHYSDRVLLLHERRLQTLDRNHLLRSREPLAEGA